MPGKKKKFIDKKHAVTFHLVHRSQRDPLAANEDAPQHVLLPVDAGSEQERAKHRQEEQQKYGIFYDDDYDYMQHLRDVSELNNVMPVTRTVPSSQTEPKLQLPSTVFASAMETEVGLLNMAAPLKGPQLDWDPDIVAALDEDFNFDDEENLLEDDFVMKANTAGSDLEEEVDGDADDDDEYETVSDDDDEDDDDEKLQSCKQHKPSRRVMKSADMSGDDSSDDNMSFGDEETKSRFTNYSMTSSVIRRNHGLTLLDDRFEKLYEQYGEDEIGALDQEDITGHMTQHSAVLNNILDEFEKQQKQTTLKDVVMVTDHIDVCEDSCESEEELAKIVVEKTDMKWDCESILSTHSTLYNHPTKITAPKKVNPIRLTKRAEIPADVLPSSGLTQKQLEKERSRERRLDPSCLQRPKDESTEQRSARKLAVKVERKLRREEKKANTVAFKTEQIRQQTQMLNVQQNLQGVRIV